MALLIHQMPSLRYYSFDLSMPRINGISIVPQKPKSRSCATRCYSHVPVYQQTSWSHDFIKGLVTDFPVNNKEKVRKLEEKVMVILSEYENGGSSMLQLLELIDDIERLGLGYRFRTNIIGILNKVASTDETEEGYDIYTITLKFRLLRQHGYTVSRGFLERLKDIHGSYIRGLHIDVKLLLSIYEASYLAIEGELYLHESQLFATENLVKLNGQVNKVTEDQIKYALDTPLYRRMHRLQARWYIDAYSKRTDANLSLLDLAILDFNMIQLVYKRELQEVSKWWEDIGLANKLSFIRDRIMELFFWSVGLVSEPQYSYSRVVLTKVGALITTIDDIYDNCGSIDELKIFTNAVKRWDINAVEHMPEYLKLGFLALYNTINDMGYDALISHEENTIPTLAKVWGELCETFYVEAKWAQTSYMPTFEEYLDNGWRSVSGVTLLTHSYLLMNQDIKSDPLESLEKCHDLIKWSSMIFRLYNDLASEDEIDRGKSVNAISCYMQEYGVCEEVAREYIDTLIDETWRKMIEARLAYSKDLADSFADVAINLARVSHCMYQYGDGVKAPDARANDRVLSMIIDPIPVRM